MMMCPLWRLIHTLYAGQRRWWRSFQMVTWWNISKRKGGWEVIDAQVMPIYSICIDQFKLKLICMEKLGIFIGLLMSFFCMVKYMGIRIVSYDDNVKSFLYEARKIAFTFVQFIFWTLYWFDTDSTLQRNSQNGAKMKGSLGLLVYWYGWGSCHAGISHGTRTTMWNLGNLPCTVPSINNFLDEKELHMVWWSSHVTSFFFF